MYKIENTISAIKLIHPGTIAKRFFIDQDTVKVNGIILEKPFKLQITAVAKVDGRKKKRVLNEEYSGTLKKAINDALAKRDKWMDELKTEIKKGESQKSIKAVIEMLTLSEAFEKYIESQLIKKESNKTKFDDYRMRKLFEKHIEPTLGKAKLDDIDIDDIRKITNKMNVTRAKLGKDGKKIAIGILPNGKTQYEMEIRPAAERTKRTIYQLISPIYTFVNNSNKIKYSVNNPASMSDMPPLENERTVTVGIDAFTKLYNYKDPRFKNMFVWLMHGRRFGEVATLDYGDIDVNEGTYVIRKENNKANKDMTYILTGWQREALLDDIPESGLVFPSVNSPYKRMYSGTITTNHWDLNCTMHDLRHIIGNTLVSKGTSIEVIGRILGHKPQKNIITNRYAEVSAEAANGALVNMLEEVLV